MPSKLALLSHGGFVSIFLICALFLTLFSLRSLAGSPNLLILQSLGSHHGSDKRTDRGDEYLLGVGKGDITGPIVELNFMGYANSEQIGTGLRQRIFARAFIIGDKNKQDNRFIYLNIDTSCGDTAIRNGILEGVAALGSNFSVYGQQNIAVVGTHQHSGPGAFMNYLLPQVTSLGFSQQSYQAIVDGSVLAIKRAHESLTPGYLDVASTTVKSANINRSVYAYLANPVSERSQYQDDVEKTMTMLRLQRASDGKNIGILTWFPVHGTSTLANNTHVTGDNKGVAQNMFEKAMVGDPSAAEGFVAGYSQSSVADTSPNVLGAWCDDGSGKQCSIENSTCADGSAKKCRGRGPLFDKVDLGISSCYEIGKRQFEPALELYRKFDSSATPVRDSSVKAFHFFQDMQYYNFTYNGRQVQTCPAALGYSFAAGTTDMPGPFDFTQNNPGAPGANPLWQVVSKVIRNPTKQQTKCHGEKPILLDIGEMSVPYAWGPNIVDIQVFRVGQMLMIISPSEVSTMAGRRWRNAVASAAKEQSLVSSEPIVVLGSPANTYAHYVVTPEEYSIQRYEGASTLYGPYTLPAYINLAVSNLRFLSSSATFSPSQGILPPDNRKKSLSFITGVVLDSPGPGKKFGDLVTPVRSSYRRGDVVKATFIAANPRNNLRLEGTYVAVEQQVNGVWRRIRDDSDWFLTLTWKRDNVVLGTSHVDVAWETVGEAGLQPGTYRLRYWGDAKSLFGKVTPFEGTTTAFDLI